MKAPAELGPILLILATVGISAFFCFIRLAWLLVRFVLKRAGFLR